jgi:hypothetical protein
MLQLPRKQLLSHPLQRRRASTQTCRHTQRPRAITLLPTVPLILLILEFHSLPIARAVLRTTRWARTTACLSRSLTSTILSLPSSRPTTMAPMRPWYRIPRQTISSISPRSTRPRLSLRLQPETRKRQTVCAKHATHAACVK